MEEEEEEEEEVEEDSTTSRRSRSRGLDRSPILSFSILDS
jgi:hypothetical protein